MNEKLEDVCRDILDHEPLSREAHDRLGRVLRQRQRHVFVEPWPGERDERGRLVARTERSLGGRDDG